MECNLNYLKIIIVLFDITLKTLFQYFPCSVVSWKTEIVSQVKKKKRYFAPVLIILLFVLYP